VTDPKIMLRKSRGSSGYGCLRYFRIFGCINRTQKSQFHGFIGTIKSMRSLAQDFGRSFLKGQAAAAALFSPG